MTPANALMRAGVVSWFHDLIARVLHARACGPASGDAGVRPERLRAYPLDFQTKIAIAMCVLRLASVGRSSKRHCATLLPIEKQPRIAAGRQLWTCNSMTG